MLVSLQYLITNILTIVFAVSIPVNIHKERQDRHRKVRNLIVVSLGAMVATAVLLIHSYRQNNWVVAMVSAHLVASVVYSMIFILLTKPGARMKSREKSERMIAVIVLFIVAVSSASFLLHADKFTTKQMQQNGGIVLAIICIILSISKIKSDIKKLIQTEKTYPADELLLSELGITQREHEVMRLLITGRTYKEIAAELFISLPTVKTHVSSIYSKANVRNRLELSNLIR